MKEKEKNIEIILPHNHGTDTAKAISIMPSPQIIESAANAFKLISDPTRLEIVWLLCHTEDCVVNIATAVGMSSPAVSHHLRLLKNAGILQTRRDGKEAYYTLADTEDASKLKQTLEAAFSTLVERNPIK